MSARPIRSRKVRVSLEGFRFTIEIPEGLNPGPLTKVYQMAEMRGWLLLGSFERDIVRVLLERGPLTREALAAVLDVSPDAALKYFLPNMAEKNVLTKGADGWRVNWPEDSRQFLLDFVRNGGGGREV